MGFVVWALAPLLLLCSFLDETQIWLGDLRVVFVVVVWCFGCYDLLAGIPGPKVFLCIVTFNCLCSRKDRASERHRPYSREKNGKGFGKKDTVKKQLKQHHGKKGKQICFAFNKKKGCARQNCRFAHICHKSHENHSLMNCPQAHRDSAEALE